MTVTLTLANTYVLVAVPASDDEKANNKHTQVGLKNDREFKMTI